MTNRKRGKNTEKAITKMINSVGMEARRVGIFGGEDIETNKYSVEVKGRKSFIGERFMLQAEKNTKGDKIPLVIVHLTGKKHTEDLVLMRFCDFVECQKNT